MRGRPFPAIVKATCLAEYLNTSKSLKQIAEEQNINFHTVHMWHRNDKWADRRRKMEKDLEERTVAECVQIASEARAEVMRRHLKVGGKLEDAIEKKLDANAGINAIPMQPRDLADLGKALKSSGDVSGRAVGLDLRREEQKSQINLLINTGFTPVPAEPKPVEAIDVQADEETEPDPF